MHVYEKKTQRNDRVNVRASRKRARMVVANLIRCFIHEHREGCCGGFENEPRSRGALTVSYDSRCFYRRVPVEKNCVCGDRCAALL